MSTSCKNFDLQQETYISPPFVPQILVTQQFPLTNQLSPITQKLPTLMQIIMYLKKKFMWSIAVNEPTCNDEQERHLFNLSILITFPCQQSVTTYGSVSDLK